MTEKDKQIIQVCGKLVASLSERDKEKFLSFTEGMAFLSDRYRTTTNTMPRQEMRT